MVFWERKENATYTAKTAEPETEPAASDRTGAEAETPMPVLYKKSFKTLPRWDFEDVYNQDARPRNTVSSETQETAQFLLLVWKQ